MAQEELSSVQSRTAGSRKTQFPTACSTGAAASGLRRSTGESSRRRRSPTHTIRTTPAQGFYLRHVKGIEMSGIKIECTGADARPVYALDDVTGADFRFLKMPAGATSSFALTKVRDFSVFRSKPVADVELAEADDKRL